MNHPKNMYKAVGFFPRLLMPKFSNFDFKSIYKKHFMLKKRGII